jgi:hypothetical protein
MDADEAGGVKQIFELIHGPLFEKISAAAPEADLVVLGLHAIDVHTGGRTSAGIRYLADPFGVTMCFAITEWPNAAQVDR